MSNGRKAIVCAINPANCDRILVWTLQGLRVAGGEVAAVALDEGPAHTARRRLEELEVESARLVKSQLLRYFVVPIE